MYKVFRNKTILQILDKYKDLWALSHVAGVAHWDLETYMPGKGVDARGEALGRLSTIRQRLFLDKPFINLIHKTEDLKLNDYEAGVRRMLLRSLKFYEKLPADFLEEFEILTNKATVVWREAKEKNDLKLFEPYLSKIFAMNRKMADYLGYTKSPYDALLDQFEEGLTSDSVSQFFNKVNKPLQELLKNITSSKKYQKTSPLESAKYDQKKMEKLNLRVLKFFWPDFERFRLDISTHPFTTSFGKNDTRITTRYHDADFARSLMAVVHEFGHGLYDLQSADELEITPVAGGSSLVIHESQSRFWENFVGRSEPFAKKFLPDFEYVIGHKLSVPEVYLYFNKVSPGLLRVEADEVTYHFHIMLRFEIEKGIIEGRLKTKDLREIWNEKMKEYLGITPKKDSEGVLQDIHWGGGSVGYFPTYSLGTFLSAQWAERMMGELGTMNYGGIEKWLEEHVHKHGSTYTLGDLLKKNGMKFDPRVNLKHLEEKYSKIYGFKA